MVALRPPRKNRAAYISRRDEQPLVRVTVYIYAAPILQAGTDKSILSPFPATWSPAQGGSEPSAARSAPGAQFRLLLPLQGGAVTRIDAAEGGAERPPFVHRLAPR